MLWVAIHFPDLPPNCLEPLRNNASVIALVVMAVAAGEATVGLAIVIAIYRNRKTPLVDEYDAMRQ